MLSKCANPACSANFRYLHEGRLFHVEIGLAAPDPENLATRSNASGFVKNAPRV
jgi:hypothetical protein